MAGDYYMNIELGKEMFYKCYGNSFYIYMEFGKAYKKCKVPKEYEIEWRKDIQSKLYEKINNTKGKTRFSSYLILCDIISLEEAIELTCKLLNTNLDYFERLRYTENLKDLNRHANSRKLLDIINKNKVILVENVNLVMKQSKKYIFLPEDNIKERINEL